MYDFSISRRSAVKLAGAAALSAGLLSRPDARALAEQGGGRFVPGTYTATAEGFHGPVTLQVVFGADSIESVEAVEHSETYDAGRIALERLCSEAVEEQSFGIDSVAGATLSSLAFFNAARDCLEQAGADVAALTAPVEKEVRAEPLRLDADVVVVGSGIAGWSAAVSAAEQGAKVIVLEKLGLEGGNAKFSLGTFMICQVPENADYHISDEEDTLEAALARWEDYQRESGADSVYPDYERVRDDLVQTMCTIDWLKGLGADFEYTASYVDDRMSMAQVVMPGADDEGTPVAKLMRMLEEIAVSKGAEVRIDTPATGLIVEDGAVVGVNAEAPDGPLEIAAKSVIIASGGFSASADLVAEKLPMLDELMYVGARGADGDGIAMAEAAGAAPFEDNWIIATPICPTNAFFFTNPRSFIFEEINPMYDAEVSDTTYHRLVVNSDAERFMNEAAHYALQNVTLANLRQGPYYALYSGLDEEKAAIMETGIPTGTVFKADTIADLAAAAGLDPDALQSAVDEYNRVCAAGVDDDFEKPAEYLDKPIEQGPYYLMQVVVSCSDTLGGVKTDERRQCLDESGNPIPGLYAIGSSSNKMRYNRMYFSGSSLTFNTTDGRIAGAAAAGCADPVAYPAK